MLEEKYTTKGIVIYRYKNRLTYAMVENDAHDLVLHKAMSLTSTFANDNSFLVVGFTFVMVHGRRRNCHFILRSRRNIQSVSWAMEPQLLNADPSTARVKVTLHLGSETHSALASKGPISEQLTSVKEQSMSILKDFITKNNIPNDVPDDLDEISSDDDDDDDVVSAKPPVKKSKNKQ
ncbi:hypothetical protein AAHA92_28745 [Salvia divinorum]|uniref:Uncharacterized protein n=1 Tax=Salvia divinorum TaxID=28513 RepID=A0ABD1FYK3_SALDI